MIIIPAIDILENKIVRLKKGDFEQVTFYEKSPIEQVKLYESFGFEWIHIVDLAGSKEGKVNIGELLTQIKNETSVQVEFGGGIRNLDSVKYLFELGVSRVIIGSLSIKNKPEFEKIVSSYTPDKFVIATDVNNNFVAVTGWLETTGVTLSAHIKYCAGLGIKTFLCTDISKDGMLSGLNFKLYEDTMNEFPDINIIASGGVKDINDIKETAKRNLYGVVIGKAIYENKIDLKELAEIGK
jgi:phosphoribosylformimino-5-aminoimidazole carboxamide ribotide isomerase